jgi:hypothetical protein
MINIKSVIILFLLIAIYKSSWAQDEDALPTSTEEVDSLLKGHPASEMRLKKNYHLGDGINIISKDAQFAIQQSIQAYYAFNAPTDFNSLNSGFRIRRARLNIAGLLFDSKVFVRVRLNLADDYQSTTTGSRSYNSVLQDAIIEYRPSSTQRINFGLRADYSDTREIRVEGESLGFVERSIVSGAFDAIFDYGLRYRGTFRAGRSAFRTYLSITTGDGNASLQKNFNGLKYGARVDFLPFGFFSKGGEFYMDDNAYERTPKLVIGAVYSINNGVSSAKGTNGGRYLYGDSTQKLLRPNLYKGGVDYMFKYKGFYSLGDVAWTRATVPNGIAGEFSLSGAFTPYTGQTPDQIKNTVLSRINAGFGYNFQAGYLIKSKWAIGGRYSHLEQDQHSALFADVDGLYSVVVTRYIVGHNLKINFENGFEHFNKALTTETANGNFYSQLMLTVMF